jgi:lactoylglutathione lyase
MSLQRGPQVQSMTRNGPMATFTADTITSAVGEAMPTLSPCSLFEAHLNVCELDRSMAFYSEVLGLELAHINKERKTAFFWIGERGRSMLGLWAGSSSPNVMQLHLAFRVELEDLLGWRERLSKVGVVTLDFFGKPAAEPSVIAWMPAASIFFRDPDNHLLELLAMLPDAPHPSGGIVSYSAWQKIKIDQKVGV